MPSPALLAQVSLYSLLLISFAQTPPQSTTPVSKAPRIQMNQVRLCCSILNFVKPIYPRESRLTHTEGVVKLIMIIADNGSVADLQAVSGDPLLLDSAISAVRQWRFQPSLMNGSPVEAEVPLSFTFSIHDPPKPAYLQLTDGKVIRADEVREFTDRIDYTVGRRTHHLSADSVTAIYACAPNHCVPSGWPSFNIIAIPLLPAGKVRSMLVSPDKMR